MKFNTTNLFLANSALVWCGQECDMKCVGLVELNDKLILGFQENQSFFHELVIVRNYQSTYTVCDFLKAY